MTPTPATAQGRSAVSPGATSLWRAYTGWRSVAGPLADFVLPAPFLAAWSPAGRLPVAPGAAGVAGELSRRAGRDTMVFLEAAPRLGLAVGLRLGRAGWPVAPLFGRWPVHGALLPTDGLAAWLTGVADALMAATLDRSPSAGASQGAGAPPCLLLDAERHRRVDGGTLRRRFDNRYDYLAYLLPPAQRLRGWGIARLLWAGPAAAVPADLQEYAEALIGAGIVVELIRLPAAGRRAAGRRAAGRRAPRRRRVPPGFPGMPPCGR